MNTFLRISSILGSFISLACSGASLVNPPISAVPGTSGGGSATNIVMNSGPFITVTTNSPGNFTTAFDSVGFLATSNAYFGFYNGNGTGLTNLAHALTNDGSWHVYVDATAWGTNGGVTTGTSKTAGIQEVLTATPKAANIFNFNIGGGDIELGEGVFILTTNVVFPNNLTYDVRIHGKGRKTMLFLKNTNQDKTKGYFTYATNAVNGLVFTNAMSIEMDHLMFVQEDMLSTNFIVDIRGNTMFSFHDNVVTTAYGLTNGQGGTTMNWEANVPNQPIGCAGVAADCNYQNGFGGSGANSMFWCYNNIFYCLANGVACATTINRIFDNYFACIGIYNTQPPPTVNNGAIHFATNLWSGDVGGFPTLLSAGVAVTAAPTSLNSTKIYGNEFFGCGIEGAVSTETEWFLNRESLCGYRFGVDSANQIFTADIYVQQFAPTSGDNLPCDDVDLTNNVAGTKYAADGAQSGVNPRARTVPTGTRMIFMPFNDTVSGGSTKYFAFSGGPIISTNGFVGIGTAGFTGNGANVTNVHGDNINVVYSTGLTAVTNSGKVTITSTIPPSGIQACRMIADFTQTTTNNGGTILSNLTFNLTANNNYIFDLYLIMTNECVQGDPGSATFIYCTFNGGGVTIDAGNFRASLDLASQNAAGGNTVFMSTFAPFTANQALTTLIPVDTGALDYVTLNGGGSIEYHYKGYITAKTAGTFIPKFNFMTANTPKPVTIRKGSHMTVTQTSN